MVRSRVEVVACSRRLLQRYPYRVYYVREGPGTLRHGRAGAGASWPCPRRWVPVPSVAVGAQVPDGGSVQPHRAAYGEHLNPLALGIREDLVGNHGLARAAEDLHGGPVDEHTEIDLAVVVGSEGRPLHAWEVGAEADVPRRPAVDVHLLGCRVVPGHRLLPMARPDLKPEPVGIAQGEGRPDVERLAVGPPAGEVHRPRPHGDVASGDRAALAQRRELPNRPLDQADLVADRAQSHLAGDAHRAPPRGRRDAVAILPVVHPADHVTLAVR